ncbi:MAG: winged helix-turn-helix domain-containing protein, partial [Clostridia bacterium]|nr:winged helix-turn-helix domain-containing protein [Clostridia bacterium]
VYQRRVKNRLCRRLRVFMATLRKKIETEPDSPQYIQTHIGVGYQMLKL